MSDTTRTVSYAVNIEDGQAYQCFGKLVLSGLFPLRASGAETSLAHPGERSWFDKSVFEEFLTKLQTHRTKVFGDLPLHYDGMWDTGCRRIRNKGTVDVLLDFKN